MAKKFGEKKEDKNVTELSRLRMKYNRNAIRTRNFPVKPG